MDKTGFYLCVFIYLRIRVKCDSLQEENIILKDLYLLVPNQSMIPVFTRKPVTIIEVVVISTSSHSKMI